MTFGMVKEKGSDEAEDKTNEDEKSGKPRKLQRTEGKNPMSSRANVQALLPYNRKRKATISEHAAQHKSDWDKDITLIEESLHFLSDTDDSLTIFEAIEFSLQHNVMEAYIRVIQNMYLFTSLECAMLALVLAAYWRASFPSIIYLCILLFAITFPRRVVDEWWQYAVLTMMITVVGQSGMIVFYPMVQCVTSASGAECSSTALSTSSSSTPLLTWLSVVFQRPGVLFPDLVAFIFAAQ